MQKRILYPFLSDRQKTKMIFLGVSHEDYVLKIIQKMKKVGYKIDFTWFGSAAAYFPKIVTLSEKDAPLDIMTLRTLHNVKAHFGFSKRFSFSYHCHHFIHELIHFEQDMNGEFLTPLLKLGQEETLLPRDDYIYNYLHLEAMAAIQAIEISYDLKHTHNVPYAWRGCYYSFNWHSLSKHYQKLMRAGKPKAEAFESCYAAWFNSKQKTYAEDIAHQNYNHLEQIITQHNKAIHKENA